jgi:hypothetical protein
MKISTPLKRRHLIGYRGDHLSGWTAARPGSHGAGADLCRRSFLAEPLIRHGILDPDAITMNAFSDPRPVAANPFA